MWATPIFRSATGRMIAALGGPSRVVPLTNVANLAKLAAPQPSTKLSETPACRRPSSWTTAPRTVSRSTALEQGPHRRFGTKASDQMDRSRLQLWGQREPASRTALGPPAHRYHLAKLIERAQASRLGAQAFVGANRASFRRFVGTCRRLRTGGLRTVGRHVCCEKCG